MKKVMMILLIMALVGCVVRVYAGYNEDKIREAQTPRKESRLDKFLIDFTDNTKQYTGQTIMIPLFVSSFGLLHDGKANHEGHSLREWVGSDVDFWNGNFQIRISIPKPLSVPNAHHAELLIVTFVCEKGDLKSGNRAISIKRP